MFGAQYMLLSIGRIVNEEFDILVNGLMEANKDFGRLLEC